MRIEPELKEDLQRLADEQNRSLTNYVESILKQHVEQEKARRARADKPKR
jgi:predicted HicB family RNase H-like nuclease